MAPGSWDTRYRRWVLSLPWAVGMPLWIVTHPFVLTVGFLGPRRWSTRRESLRASAQRRSA
jgi:hypothetical protein